MTRCAACGGSLSDVFFEVDGVPVQSCVLLEDEGSARDYPVGTVRLAACQACGFVQNVAFEPSLVDYTLPTEESQAYSARFRAFSDELAATVHDRFDLSSKSVVEIGCGKADFLVSLAALGIRSGHGIDPGYIPQRQALPANVSVERAFFDARTNPRSADLVVTRHTLEHVPDVGVFMGALAELARRGGGAMFTELPDAQRVFVDIAWWDVYYEHCSYFTFGSLGRLLRSHGFEQTRMWRGFGDQYLLADSIQATDPVVHEREEPIADVLGWVDGFADRAAADIARWRELVDGVVARGDTLALWGGGSKAVAFLAAIQAGGEQVTVVDINPHKQGMWLPGAGTRVIAPADLTDVRPTDVIVMNAIYEDEIRTDLDRLGIGARVSSL